MNLFNINTRQILVILGLLSISFASMAMTKPENVDVMDINGTRIHTFHGISNSHIIETKNALFMIDAQFMFKHADQLKSYIESIGKPMNMIVLSHNHPDHWFGTERLKGVAPIATSQNVIDDLKTGGGRYLKVLKKKLKGQLPEKVVVPDQTLALGAQQWDGLEVILEEFPEQEAHHTLIVKIPSLGVLIAQDMVYNNMFLVASERSRNQHWKEQLGQLKDKESKAYPHVLTGHGKNGGPELYQQNIDYLTDLENVMKENLSKEETTKKMIALYPERGGKGMLQISMRNLFSKGH